MRLRSAYDVLSVLGDCASWAIEQERAVIEIGDDVYVSELRDVLDKIFAAREALAATIPGGVPLDSIRRQTPGEVAALAAYYADPSCDGSDCPHVHNADGQHVATVDAVVELLDSNPWDAR